METLPFKFPPDSNSLSVNDTWIRTVPDCDSPYWRHVKVGALYLESDGCTLVSDLFLDACYEHDIHWRTGRTVYGNVITRKQANTRFRRVIQSRSRFGGCSPLSWVRWLGVSIGQWFIRPKS